MQHRGFKKTDPILCLVLGRKLDSSAPLGDGHLLVYLSTAHLGVSLLVHLIVLQEKQRVWVRVLATLV